ncbi:hypothetical protein Sjap_005742 [Stephania japonica]|uniref:Uncharacterized protein n=1 Tax=Stephania japonica TaxID=461633 RepID=A0AAP0PKE4_9MAGN
MRLIGNLVELRGTDGGSLWREGGLVEEEEVEMSCNGGIRWETVLHRMAIRVMLVEADDSTRQIIAALLRKCGYRVAAVPDGSKAWEALKGRPHNVDLVLTEVELPSVSGFDLLTMIMEHEVCRNIPVIMMSSHDTMSMIFNCMLSGAADFLVKPIRKNELINLWQHIWRRQSSTGNSHGPQEGSSARQKLEAASENRAASNQSKGCPVVGQKNKEFSEKESDTHSTCTKPIVEAESASVHNMQDLLLPAATLARDTMLHNHGDNIKLDLEVPLHERHEGKLIKFECTRTGDEDTNSVELVEQEFANTISQGKQVAESSIGEDDNLCLGTEDKDPDQVEGSAVAIDLIGTFDNISHTSKFVLQKDSCDIAKPYLGSSDLSSKLNSNLLLELSLRGSHPSEQGNQQKNSWNHSYASAFSRYTNRSPRTVSSHTETTECMDNSPNNISNQYSVDPNEASQCDGATLKEDRDQESPVVYVARHVKASRPFPRLGGVSLPTGSMGCSLPGLGSASPPMFCTQSGMAPQTCSPNSASQQGSNINVNSSRHYDPEPHSIDQCHPLHDKSASTSTKRLEKLHQSLESGENVVLISPGTGQSGTTSLRDGAGIHGNSGGCGSICNGRNENIAATTPSRAVLENGKSEGLLIHEGTRGMNPHRSSQREAALNKFRLKRKDRCYEKKVRYESRQKLAEQRPRVKGQFVRQAPAKPPPQ